MSNGPQTDNRPVVLRWNIDGDYYKDGMTLYADGTLSIDVGGIVVVKPLRSWQGLEIALSRAEEEIKTLKALVEKQGWNLGGCSTYALGYSLNEPHSEEMALPALNDVKFLALRQKKCREFLSQAITIMKKVKKRINPSGRLGAYLATDAKVYKEICEFLAVGKEK